MAKPIKSDLAQRESYIFLNKNFDHNIIINRQQI